MQVNLSGVIQFASQQSLRIFRVDQPSELVGTRLVDWIEPEDQNRANEHLHWCHQAQDAPVAVEYRLRLHRESLSTNQTISIPDSILSDDLSTLWVEITFVPLTEVTEIHGILATIREFTESRQLEMSLQQNLERQEFLNHLLQLLYRPDDLNMALEQVLASIGAHTRAGHVFLAQYSQDGQSAEILLEWYAVDAQVEHSRPHSIAIKQYPTFHKLMESHGIVCISEKLTLAPDLRLLLHQWKVRTFVAVPVYGKNCPYGFIAYNDLGIHSTWELEEQDLLRSISRAVSSAISRQQVEEDEHNQRVLAEVLRDISSFLNSTLNFKDMLDSLLINLERLIPHQAANIALVDDQNILTIEQARGYPASVLETVRRLKMPVAQWKTFHRLSQIFEPVLIPNVDQDPDWVSIPELNWTKSFIGAAIRARGKILGILNVDSPIPHFFTQDHAERVQAFADHAAVAIENARLYQEAQRRADEMTSLYQIGLTLAQGLDLEEIYTTLHSRCSQVLPNDVFYVALFDEKTFILSHPLFYEAGQYKTILPRDMRVMPGLSGQVILNRKTTYLPDTLLPEKTGEMVIVRTGGRPSRSYIGVPLIAHDQAIGVISMQSYSPNAYTGEQIRLLETIANQAAIIIENARIFNQMKQLAITDGLTGVFTRWHFTSLGQVEIGRAKRYNRQLAVIMMDIDRFKDFNDTYGHMIGDQVIQAVAKMCQKGLRSSDIIGRYGGDEFVIILPEAALERALHTAERIRTLINTIEVTTESQTIPATVSMGVAILTASYQTLDDLLISADRALYQAKEAGRNQIKVFAGTSSNIEQTNTRVTTQER